MFIADELHRYCASGATERRRHRNTGGVQQAELPVLLLHPQRLPRIDAGTRMLVDGLLQSHVSDIPPLAVDHVVPEGAYAQVGVDLHRDETIPPSADEHGRFLAAFELVEQLIKDAPLVQILQPALLEPRRFVMDRERFRLGVAHRQIADRAGAAYASSLLSAIEP